MLFNLVHFRMHITDHVMFGLGEPLDARRNFVQFFQQGVLTR
jgi:hypothetical protein